MVHALSSLPATDLNFVACLKRATKEEITQAIEIMKSRDGKDKGRISACERELNKRKKSCRNNCTVL